MKRIWGAGIVFTSLVAFAAWYFLYRDTSIYATQFSEAQFTRVRIGMTVDEAVALLGPPLSIDDSPSPESWSWIDAPDEYERSTLKGDLTQVVFSASGQVTSVSGWAGSLVKRGMSRAEVTQILGSPRWRSGPRSKVMHYSQPSSYGVFHARIIELDSRGRVSNLITYQLSE